MCSQAWIFQNPSCHWTSRLAHCTPWEQSCAPTSHLLKHDPPRPSPPPSRLTITNMKNLRGESSHWCLKLTAHNKSNSPCRVCARLWQSSINGANIHPTVLIKVLLFLWTHRTYFAYFKQVRRWRMLLVVMILTRRFKLLIAKVKVKHHFGATV